MTWNAVFTSGTACAAAPEEKSSSAQPLPAVSPSSFCSFFSSFIFLVLCNSFSLWFLPALVLGWFPAVHQTRRACKLKTKRRGETRERRTLTREGTIKYEVGKKSSRLCYECRCREVGAGEEKERDGGGGIGGIKKLECADIGDLSFCLHLAQHILSLHRFVHTFSYLPTHTLTYMLTVCFGGWSQEAMPGEVNTFQGAKFPPTLLPNSTLLLSSHSFSWPIWLTCTSINTLQLQSNRKTRILPECPQDTAAVTPAEEN